MLSKYFFQLKERRQSQQYNVEDCNHTTKDRFCTKNQKKWPKLFFDFFTIFMAKGVGLPISMIFFSEEKFLQENYCFNKSSTTQS
jgi:hypothetical protein